MNTNSKSLFDPSILEDYNVWINRLDINHDYPLNDPLYMFIGEYRLLSNFHITPVKYEGITYLSSEHAYQAVKTLDNSMREMISQATSPSKAKKMGFSVTIRDNWNTIKYQIMEDIVRIKFNSNKEIADKLIATGDRYLIESTTWHDCDWGICIKKNCEKGCKNKRGKNNLGNILMKIRKELKDKINYE